MVRQHHRPSELEQTPGDRRGQRSLACCSPWGSQRVGHNLGTEQSNSDVFFMNLLLGKAQRVQLTSVALDVSCGGSDAEACSLVR